MPTKRIKERTKSIKKREKKIRDATNMDGRRSGPKTPKQRAALFTSADKKSRPAKLLELVPGPANNIHSYMDTKSLINLGLTSPQMESSLKNAVGDLVRDDLLFKNFWEEQELDKYYYSLPMNINVPGDSSRREKILYKIKKDNVSVFYGGDAGRYFHRFGLAASQIGCLNTIKYFDKEMRIYDFPYPVPTIDEPAELDNDWKRAIHYRWGGKAYFNLAAKQSADATYATILGHIDNNNKEQIEERYIKYFKEGDQVTEEEFGKIIMKEKLSWCYLDEQKRWVKEVFFMDRDTDNPIKHVELTNMYDSFRDMVMDSNECCDRLCKKVKESCNIMGGRRRRKKNRKKRTKKKARRKRRRKSSKRRRRRKR